MTANKPNKMLVLCAQCNKKFEIDRDRKPRPDLCTKKCYQKYHGVKL